MRNFGRNELIKGQIPLKSIRIHPLFAIFKAKKIPSGGGAIRQIEFYTIPNGSLQTVLLRPGQGVKPLGPDCHEM